MNKNDRMVKFPLLQTWVARVLRIFDRFAPLGGFKRDAFVLIIGVLIAAAINLISTPIITRIYSPAQMGLLEVLTTIGSIVTPMAAWRYESSIMLPDDDRDAAVIITLSMLIVSVMSFLVFLLTIWLGAGIGRILNAPELVPWLWLVAVLMLFSGFYQIQQTWYSRIKQFVYIATSRVSRAVAIAVVQISAGLLFTASTGGLLGGYISGLVAETGVLIASLRKVRAPDLRHTLDPGLLKKMLVRYRKFPIYSMLGGIVVGNVSLFLSAFFGPIEAGYFSISKRILALPISLIGASVSTVFYQRLAEAAKQPQKGSKMIADVFVGFFFLGVVPLAVVALVGPQLFGFVFGEKWVMAGRFAQLLAPGYLFFFCAFPIITASYVYEKQEITLIWQLTLLVFTGLSIWVGALLNNSLLAIGLYSTCQVILYGLIVVLAFRWSGAMLREIPHYCFASARSLTRQPLDWVKRKWGKRGSGKD